MSNVVPFEKMDLLPDCRAKDTRGRVFTAAGVQVPVFCANCGVHGGWCPEENMNFIFYLCNKCVETCGEIAGVMLMPDEVFYEKCRQEQMASYGRYLTQEEIAKVVEDGSSPLAKLLTQG